MASAVHGSHEVRLARIDGPVDPGWLLEMSGWPLTAPTPPTAVPNGLQTADLTSTVQPYLGFTTVDVRRTDNPDALGNHTAIPLTQAPAVPAQLYAAVITLSATPQPPPHLTLEDTTLQITWPDTTQSTLTLPTP